LHVFSHAEISRAVQVQIIPSPLNEQSQSRAELVRPLKVILRRTVIRCTGL